MLLKFILQPGMNRAMLKESLSGKVTYKIIGIIAYDVRSILNKIATAEKNLFNSLLIVWHIYLRVFRFFWYAFH